MEKILEMQTLDSLRPLASTFGCLGDDYAIATIELAVAPVPMPFDTPVRTNGITAIMLRQGSITLQLDGEPLKLTPCSMLMLNHHNIVTLDSWDRPTFDIFLANPKFLHDLNIDFSAINLRELVETRPSPLISGLTPQQVESFGCYFRLLYNNTQTEQEAAFSKNIARSLVQAFLYQLLLMHSNRSYQAARTGSRSQQQRQVSYVQDFMHLLQLHHTSQRSINFYADKLCISGKYLSHLIKEATGRSATDWIAEFVIMEAKNMLRFSNKNVQQVAYELNFSTQSSFGKYFKHITGMSPTDFQKT